MKRLTLCMLVLLGVVGCASDGGPHEDTETKPSESEIGNLSLSLTGTDSQGRVYRLRNAEFVVSSGPYWGEWPGVSYDGGTPFSTVVSTESDPDADTIRLRLVPGEYTVRLQGTWYVERLTPDGAERVQRVVLLSEPYQYAYVYHNSAFRVAFRFGIDGDLIDFRHGDLQIEPEFELPGDSDYDAGWPVYDGGSWL